MGDDQTLLSTILRHQSDRIVHRILGGFRSIRFAVEFDLAAGDLVDAEQRSGDFGSTGAHEACQADDFTSTDFEADVLHTLIGTQISHLKQGFADLRPILMMLAEHFGMLADNTFDDLLIGEVSHIRSDQVLTVTKNRDTVGDLTNLIHTMGNVDQRNAFVPQMPDQIEEPVGFRRTQRSRRLVKNQHLRIRSKSLGDLSQLPVSGSERPNLNIGIQVDSKTFEKLLRLLVHSLLVEETEGIGFLRTHEDVLGYAHGWDQGEFLEDHADASVSSIFNG